jgi:hypothetical protein
MPPRYLTVLQSRSGPVASESFIVQGGAYATFPTVMASAALRLGGHAAHAAPLPCFALGQDDGGVEVHCLSPAASNTQQVKGATSG